MIKNNENFGGLSLSHTKAAAPQIVQRPGSARIAKGGFEEVANWKQNDLTLKEASVAHVRLWFGEEANAHPHDMSHVIYALAIDQLPDEGHHYQGDARAEAFATTIQAALYSPTSFTPDPVYLATAEGFTEMVKEKAEMFEDTENLIRTLSWLFGKETGQSVEEQRIASGFDLNKIIEEAKNRGIEVIRDWPFPEWQVIAPDGEIYVYNVTHPEKNIYPSGNNGVEEFKRFQIPSDQEISNVFNLLKPVLDDLRPQIRDAEPAVSDIDASILETLKVRDISARMEGVSDVPLSIHVDRQQSVVTQQQQLHYQPL